MNLENDPYYEVGSIDDIVVSQSLLQHIDPKRGGSPRKFEQAIVDRIDLKTLPIIRGKVFHLYCENPDAFAVSEAVKPPEKLGEAADLVAQTYDNLETDEQKDQMMMSIDIHILRACREVGWNKNYGDAAIIKNASSIGVYIQALNDPKNKGKIILTAVLKEQIQKCIDSLSSNEFAHRLLFWKSEFSSKRFWKEIDIYWVEMVQGYSHKCKAKLDDLEIDDEQKVVNITDPKTTGTGAYTFENSFKTYRLDIQFAMYKRAVIANFPETANYTFHYRNIVVETNNLFQTVVHKWHPDIIGEAQHDLDSLFNRVAHAKAHGFKMSFEEVLGKGEIKHKEIPPHHSWR